MGTVSIHEDINEQLDENRCSSMGDSPPVLTLSGPQFTPIINQMGNRQRQRNKAAVKEAGKGKCQAVSEDGSTKRCACYTTDKQPPAGSRSPLGEN